ncbi:MAG: hypothetical protein KF773_15095 [Deltaproteobacteria bacterium]|nr:hypothetical protein [Deltaproteobacteria bacterium]MCW5802098.1 hypothetical protein [Deltaproteobacteria bacterium]
MSKHIDEDAVVQALLDTRKEIGKEPLKKLVQAAHAANGKVVSGSFEPGDDKCPPLRLKFPWPPHPNTWDLIQKLLAGGGRVEVFPHGIPHPEEILVNVHTHGLR